MVSVWAVAAVVGKGAAGWGKEGVEDWNGWRGEIKGGHRRMVGITDWIWVSNAESRLCNAHRVSHWADQLFGLSNFCD